MNQPETAGSLDDEVDGLRGRLNSKKTQGTAVFSFSWRRDRLWSNPVVSLGQKEALRKKNGGSVWYLIRNVQCRDAENMECWMIRCRLFHLPRGYTSVFCKGTPYQCRVNSTESLPNVKCAPCGQWFLQVFSSGYASASHTHTHTQTLARLLWQACVTLHNRKRRHKRGWCYNEA